MGGSRSSALLNSSRAYSNIWSRSSRGSRCKVDFSHPMTENMEVVMSKWKKVALWVLIASVGWMKRRFEECGWNNSGQVCTSCII